MAARYDTIGVDYARLRKPDARIEQMIHRALGSAESVLNVGAGAGSYEPRDRNVTAVEPSAEMIAQRPPDAAPVVQGSAENLPFEDNAFDAAMAVLTIHHWTDQQRGLKEMRRVSKGPVVILTYDPAFRGFWLADYIPEIVSLDEEKMPAIDSYAPVLGPVDIIPVPIPHDCSDGFLCAYWRRPAAYTDPNIRAAMSTFWLIGNAAEAMQMLEQDLDSGVWEQRYGHLLSLDQLDLGYRLIVTR